MSFPTWVEIDLDKLDHNFTEIGKEVGPEVDILFVVKADGYGHGAVEIGGAVLQAGAAMLGVATLHEGLELRQNGIDGPVLILSPNLPAELDEIMAHRLWPTLSTPEQARDASAWAASHGGRITAHLEVDTGMGRTGFDGETAFESIVSLAGLPGLDLEGIFTHFPDADGSDPAFTGDQMARFDHLVRRLQNAGITFRHRHAANSAGAIRFPESRLNMIRPGLALLGVYPSPHVPRRLDLKPVMSFHCRLVQVRDVPAGRHISYGGTFVTRRNTRVGVIAAGYGHGLSRRLSNRGHVFIRSRRAPVVGRVTMDLTMVDLTDVPDARVGDEVVLFGHPEGLAAQDPPIRIEEVAGWAETIVWEVMCQIDKRVVRKYIRQGRVVKVMTLVGERLESAGGESAGVIYSGAQRFVRATTTGWRK